MANEKNLKPPQSTSEAEKEARKEASQVVKHD